ncbi:colicin V production protein [Flavobacterium columnare NBRC 100251 = ATCC 23463]|nr:colicin V production protein [Flavobacterium columnare NBRC 100251 = ATCC 23463]
MLYLKKNKMGFIDIIIGALLVFGFYKGFKNGLFVELASLVAFFVGIFIAIKFSYLVSGILQENVLWSSKTIQVSAFVITLAFVVLGIHLIAKLLSSIASFAFLGWANTLAGGAFGVLKSVLLIGVVLNLFQKVNVNDMIISKETQDNSLFFNPCMKTSEILLPVLGDWFADLKENSDKWDEKTDDVKKQEGQEGIH